MSSTQALLFAMTGEYQKAEEKIKIAIEHGKGFGHFHHTEYNIACVYALMKKNQPALDWLRKACDDGWPCYPLFTWDHNLDNLRDDPQFISFMDELKKQWEHFNSIYSEKNL